MKKIKGERKTVNHMEGCVVLYLARGKINQTDVAEFIDSHPIECGEGAYVQLHVSPAVAGEFDPALFNEDDLVVLYPMDKWLHSFSERLAPRHLPEDKMCPICGTIKIEDDWDYCPNCGQAIKRLDT